MPIEDIRYDSEVMRGFIAFSRAVGIAVLAVAAAMLATWLGGIGPLRVLLQSEIAARGGAAAVFMIACAALLTRRRAAHASSALSALVAVVGVWSWLQYRGLLPRADWAWLDALLPRWSQRPPARLTELAALCFVLLGVAGIASAQQRAAWLREAATLLVIAITMAAGASWGLVLAGHDAHLLQRLPILTAAMQFLLALAWMAATPNTGLTRIAVADSVGGAFARRLILPALLLPLLLTFVFEMVQSWLGMSEPLALALAAVAAGGTLAVMIVWVAFLLDRGERQRRTVQALRTDAGTDALTGLANRRRFDAALPAALDAHGSAVALLMLDLDRFKSFNDSFGHQAGDDVLRETGRLLRSAVRPADIAARYGGEEFVVLLPNADVARAETVAQRILAAFRQHDWPLRPVRVSIGAAVAATGESPQALIGRADAALYQSKQDGRDRCTLAAAAQATPV